MTPRTARWVADTGYLLSFGAVAQGLDLLRRIFDGGLSAPQAVKAELSDLSTTHRHPVDTKNAAAVYTGRAAGILLDAPFLQCDQPEQQTVLAFLECDILPDRTLLEDVPTAATIELDVEDVALTTTGPNAGESEAIPVCVRTGMPLLMNDGPATEYAQWRGVSVEPAAASLKRLDQHLSSREMFQVYREMTKVNNGGAVVTGHLWFRQPD